MATKLREKPKKPESFKYRFKVKDLEKMYEAGIFDPEEKIELIYGEVIRLSPIGLKHAIVVNNLVDILSDLLKETNLKSKYILSVQNPVFLSQENLAQPDVAIVSREFSKEKQHPKPKYIEVLIEVSDTTLEKDRKIKLPLYAKYEIKQVWIVDLIQNQIEVYTKPYKNEYLNVQIFPMDKEISVFNKNIKVKDILDV